MPNVVEQAMYRPQVVTRPQAVPSPQMVAEKISGSILSEWTTQTTYYDKWWDAYDGANLEVQSRTDVLKYPLKINPIRWIANRHGFGLYGEYPDNASSLVQFGFKNMQGKLDDECRAAANFINRIWYESNGSAIQLENGILGQVLGGHVYRVAWQPWNKHLSYGLRVTKVIPDYFLPVWDTDDPWYHQEVYVLFYVTGDEAKLRYGIDCNKAPYVLYSEHWTEDKYEITVDGKTPSIGEGWEGENPFGIVPFVYVPHLTRAGKDYGISHVPSLTGLIEELNSRMADRGDGVRNANYDQLVVRNTTGSGIKRRELGDMRYFDLGSPPPGSAFQPDGYYLEPNGVKAASISKEFTDDVWELICRDSDTPGVLWGESHISQRAALSMDALASSYLKHARAERIQNKIGLSIINKYLLQMALVNGVGNVTESMIKELEPTVRWPKLLPRSRMDLVQEMTQRKPVGLVSSRNAVEQLSDGENVDEELDFIDEDKQKEADMQKQKMETEMSMQTRQQNNAAKAAADSPEKKKANPAQEKKK